MVKRLPQVIDSEEVLTLLKACPDTFIGKRNKTALILAYRCGLRVSEICNLSMDDVSFKTRKVFVRQGKNGKDRYVPFDPGTHQYLKEWVGIRSGQRLKYQTPWFLVTRDGKKCCPRTFQLLLGDLSEKTGVYLSNGTERKRVNPHVLRHCFATEMLNEFGNIREVQQMLGHERIDTTMIYTAVVMPELQRKIDQRKWAIE